MRNIIEYDSQGTLVNCMMTKWWNTDFEWTLPTLKLISQDYSGRFIYSNSVGDTECRNQQGFRGQLLFLRKSPIYSTYMTGYFIQFKYPGVSYDWKLAVTDKSKIYNCETCFGTAVQSSSLLYWAPRNTSPQYQTCLISSSFTLNFFFFFFNSTKYFLQVFQGCWRKRDVFWNSCTCSCVDT